MANTYTLIASNTLGSSAASVTFSSIPSTYTDLVLKMSLRTTGSSLYIGLRFNSDSSSSYSLTRLSGNGSTASSLRDSSVTLVQPIGNNVSTDTANSFSNMEIYIPNYLVSQNKQFSSFGAEETNSSTAYMAASALLWRNTSAITSIVVSTDSGSYVSGSSFWLYGVKSS